MNMFTYCSHFSLKFKHKIFDYAFITPHTQDCLDSKYPVFYNVTKLKVLTNELDLKRAFAWCKDNDIDTEK